MSATGINIPPGGRIFLDTSPFIYYIEEKGEYIGTLAPLFEMNSKGEYQIVTSSLTLTEVLTLPYRKKEKSLVDDYEQILLHSPFVFIMSIDSHVAKRAAKIRAEYNFRTPDALQLAAAIESSSDIFLTNDRQLMRTKEEIEVVILSDLHG
ncbi:MAG: type II toxin-antitoxin system VapC family toxin [Cyclobacteriaceae bacterium]|nr:type II toxin-antitoxin system VapC family toxin [Cyclobacteriaceae bacterium]